MGWREEKARERFEAKFNRGPGCWLWSGGTSAEGYGRFWLDGDTITAHRAAWLLFRDEPIPPGMQVCHHCDTKLCVRYTNHLFLGSIGDNMRDRTFKDRQAKGVGITQHVLTERQVRAIKRRALNGETQTSIARDFPVSRITVGLIARGIRWKHIV